MIELRSRAARVGSMGKRSPRHAVSCICRLACLTLSVWVFSLAGCGAAAYSYNIVRAARSVEQAKQVDAEKLSPFEMTLAKAYLAKSREESAEASYQDAVRFAKLSRASADKAAARSRGAKKTAASGAGR